MEYRLGTVEDLDNICNLIKEAILAMEKNGIYQWDALYPERCDFELDIQNGTLYVLYDNSNLVALYVISSEYDDEYRKCEWKNPDGSSYILHRFCVSPRYQNQGIGKKVLLHIENQLKLMGYESIRLDVFSQNPFAIKLYQNNGFEKRGYADWRKGRFYLMEKKIV